jgi:uroporphyrinogen-III decarboxylase
MSKSPEELFKEREQRFNDAVSLKVPDRVPLAPLTGFFPIMYAGYSFKDGMYDYEKTAKAWKKATVDFQWDMFPPPFVMFPGPVFEALGITQMKIPGKDLPINRSYQFVEGEYMTADEYDELLTDPSDFIIRKFFPRISETLGFCAALPSIRSLASCYTLVMAGPMVAATPDFLKTMESVQKAGQELMKWLTAQVQIQTELNALGFPMLAQAIAQAPFDWVSDFLRGMRGAMLDMYRNPEELLKAMDLFIPIAVEGAIQVTTMTGVPRVFVPLHRGAAAFMSNEQFEEFYWPSLKEVLVKLVDAGLTPMPFFEGDYDPRLEYLRELPKGKVVAHIDRSDIFKVKEVIGDVLCIKGDIPPSLLCAGTPAQVEEYCKKVIEVVGEGGGYIMDGAVTGIPDEAKPENVKAMTEAVFKYGVYRK